MRKDPNSTPGEVSRPRGRPRSERRCRAILAAATEILERDGFAAVTVEAVADRAGVSKATIYRWWPNSATVLMDAFLAEIGPVEPLPDAGSARENLRRQLWEFRRVLRGRHGRAVASLIAAAQSDGAIREAFRERFLGPRVVEIRRTLALGVERGELRRDLDPHVAYDALYAPLYHRLLVGHRPLTHGFVTAVVDHALEGMSGDR